MCINTGKYTDKTKGKILSKLNSCYGWGEGLGGKNGGISFILFMYFYIALFFIMKVYYSNKDYFSLRKALWA